MRMTKNNHKASAPRERYLTAAEIAHLCNVSTKSVYRWAESGAVPAYRAGIQLRFRRDEIEAYLARDARPREIAGDAVWR